MVENSRMLELYEAGVKLFISGRPATPEMVRAYLAERTRKKMPDFVFDVEGNLDEIRY